MAAPSKIADILLRAKLLDELQMRSALAHQQQWGGRLGKVVVEKRFAREPAVVEAIAKAMNLPKMDLGALDKDPAALAKVDAAFAREKGLFPCALKDGGKTLWVAMADPSDIMTVDELALKTRCRIKPVVAGEYEINAAIDRHYLGKEKGQAAQGFGAIRAVESMELDEEEEEMKIVDMAGHTVVKRLADIKPPEPKPTPAPAPPPPPVAMPNVSAASALDDLFGAAPPAAAGGWTSEDMARLKGIRETQEKATSIVRALIDLCVEKGYFSLDEYKRKLNS